MRKFLLFSVAMLVFAMSGWAQTTRYVPGTYATIQAAITAASDGDIIQIAAGTYNETVAINKKVSLIGAGSGISGGTIITKTNGSDGAINLVASGSLANPILVKDIRIQPTGAAGISVGTFGGSTNTNVSYIELQNVSIIGSSSNAPTEQERGLYVDLNSNLSNLKILDSKFQNLTYGWYFQKAVSSEASNVRYLDISNTSFKNNIHKGIYCEKISDATFTECTFDNNGMNASLLPSYFAPWSCGVDINTKAGNYANIAFTNCIITNNGIGGAKEGAGMTIKARSDGGTYGAFPATLTNVSVTGCTITGNERGIRIGEPGKFNPQPLNVNISGCIINDNRKLYSGIDGTAYGDVVNQLNNSITLNGQTILAGQNIWYIKNGQSIPNVVSAALSGDSIYIENGTYVLTNTLNINKSLSIIGESEAGVVINASANGTGYGISVEANSVTLEKFTIIPPVVTNVLGTIIGGGYAIHASFNHLIPVSPYINLILKNITIENGYRSSFDIHGYDGVTLDHLTAKSNAYGNGISITGSKNVTITNCTTQSNAWGGIAIYCSNSTYLNRGSDNVTFDFNANNISEHFYVEDESGLTSTNINVSNWNYSINNKYSTLANYTSYINRPLADALLVGAGLNMKFSNQLSYCWNPSLTNYYVGPGMAIQRAVNMASANGTVNVVAGLYNEDVNVAKNLTLLGPKANTPRNTGSATDWTSSTTALWTNTDAQTSGEAVIRSLLPTIPNGYTQFAVVYIPVGFDVTVKGFVIEARNRVDGTNVHLVYVEAKVYGVPYGPIKTVILENNIIGPITGDVQNGAKGRMGINFDSQLGGNNGLSGLVKGNKIFGAEGNGNNLFIIGNPYYGSMSDYSGMVIENNDIYGTNRAGIELCNGIRGLTIKNNTIINSGLIWNGIADAYVRSSTYTSSLNYGTGINLLRGGTEITANNNREWNYLDGLVISGNVISNNDKMGIYAEPNLKNSIITGNIIEINGWDGIWLDEHGTFNITKPNHEGYGYMNGVTVTNNTITGAIGAYAAVRVTGKPEFLSVTNNDLSGNVKGIIQYDGDGQNWTYFVPATCNWFGTSIPSDIAAKISGNVTFLPFWTTLTGPCDGAGPVVNVTNSPNRSYMTIQAAIDAPTTINGDVITVAAGTYEEDIIVNKSLTIHGPNYQINPCSGNRETEAIVVPASPAISYGEIFHVAASNVTISGFTIDGDNTAITSGYSSTNGADIDAAEGITVYETGVNNLTVSNNIIKNLSYFGVTLYDYPAGIPSSGHVISNNKIQDLGTYDGGSGIDFWGGGVLLYNNQYASVINNCMENVRLGIQTGNFGGANPGGNLAFQVFDNNTIQTRRTGIFHNLQYGTASPITMSNNSITALQNSNETKWNGIALSSLSVASTSVNNIINGNGISRSNLTKGYEVWNVKNTYPALISGGSVTGVDIGVFANNFEGYNISGTDGAYAVVSGLSITPKSSGIGVKAYDSPSYADTIPPARVNVVLLDHCSITGGATGVLGEGDDASITLTNSYTTISDNEVGIRVKDGADLANVSRNTITNNTMGGIIIESTADSIGLINYNNISGNGFAFDPVHGLGLKNDKIRPVFATKNWWGHATGPYSEANNCGQGNSVLNMPSICPWYTDDAMVGDSPNGCITWNFQFVTGGGSYCAGGPGVSVGLSMSQPGVNYTLFNGGSIVSTLPGADYQPLDFGLQTVAGIYTVQANNPFTGCSLSMLGSATVSVKASPSATITQSLLPEFCQGQYVVLTANCSEPVSSYLWSTGETTESIEAVPSLIPYTVTVTNNQGCQATASYTVVGDEKNLLSSYVMLAGKKIELTGTTVTSGGLGVKDGHEGKIDAQKGTMVIAAGTFAKAHAISVDNSSTITTKVKSPATVTWPAFEEMTGNGTISVNIRNGHTETLNGNLYKEIKVGKGATAIFTGDDIHIRKDLKMEEGATLQFEDCAKVHLKGKLEAKKRVIINAEGLSVVFYVEDEVTFDEGANVTGVFYLGGHEHHGDTEGGNNGWENNDNDQGNHQLKIADSKSREPGQFTGMFLADKISSGKNTFFTMNPFCENCNAPAQPNKELIETNLPLAESVMMLKNYPNPFSDKTTVVFRLTDDTHVKLDVFDISGKLIRTIFDGEVKMNQEYQAEFDGTMLMPGIYIYRMTTNEEVFMHKMIHTR